MTIYAVAAVRVSSTKQGIQGDSLDQQSGMIEVKRKQVEEVLGNNIRIEKTFEFIVSASGELDTQPINEVIDYLRTHRNIKYFFIKSIDRFTRAGSVIYGRLKSELTKLGVQMIDCYGVISNTEVNTLGHLGVEYKWSKFSPSYSNEILESEKARDEVRNILSRLIGAEIGYVRQGYRVRQAPMGFQNKKEDTEHGLRNTLEPHPVESKWIIRMFELRSQGTLSDEEITQNVNLLGFKSRRRKRHDKHDYSKIIGYGGEIPLSVEQMQKYIKNPVYAGICKEKWTNGKLVKGRFDGLVSIALWNNANRGKWTIIESEGQIHFVHGNYSAWEKQHKKENPDYAYRSVIVCPLCGMIPYASPSRSGGGKHIIYVDCRRHHKRWTVPYEKLCEAIKSYIGDVEITEEMYIKIRDRILARWEDKREKLAGDSLTITQQIEKLKQERLMIVEKIKVLSSISVIKDFESDIEDLDQKIETLRQNEHKTNKEEISVQEILNTFRYFYEHFDDLLLEGSNPLKNAAMISLIFEEQPTYDKLLLRTAKLAPIVKLKPKASTPQSSLVRLEGLEPPTE